LDARDREELEFSLGTGIVALLVDLETWVRFLAHNKLEEPNDPQ
jgi:hypothetical protein